MQFDNSFAAEDQVAPFAENLQAMVSATPRS